MLYRYRIGGWGGTVEADDVRDALKKSLDVYLSSRDPPYLDEGYAHLNVYVELAG